MRARLVLVLTLVVALALAALSTPAFAQSPTPDDEATEDTVPGSVGGEEGNEGDDAPGDEDEGGDQSTDVGTEEEGAEGAQEGEAQEPGPPWTYQMSWMLLIGLVLLFLAIARMYWSFVGRQKAQS